MTIRTVLARWNAADLTFKVVNAYGRIARGQFVDGEDYPLDIKEQRSSAEHKHYWASVTNVWNHIQDEETKAILNTPSKLRQWALVQAGWCDVTVFGPLTKRAAINAARKAALHFRHFRGEDDYVEIVVRQSHDEETGEIDGWAVVIKTPKSQSRAAMDKEAFRASKRDVLDLLSGAIEVKRRDLEQSAKDTA